MNENVNSPADENEDDLVIGNDPADGEELPGVSAGEDSGIGDSDIGEDAEAGDSEAGEDDETTGEDDEEQTQETVEVSGKEEEEPTFDVLTGVLLGTSLVLAAIVAVLTVLLLRRRKQQPQAAAQSPVQSAEKPMGGISVGKLHELGDRESQQDCFAVSPVEMLSTHGLLAVVADGMGGLADGDKVSQCVVSTMLDGFFSASGTPGDLLLSLSERANRRVNQLLGPGNIGKSGSTLVAGLIRDGQFHYVSIGDSRICLYRNGQLIQLNREHIYRNELAIQAVNGVGTLQGAASHPKAAGLTSYLGMGQLRYVDIPACGIAIRGGDKFILMSDGVYNALSTAELSGALNEDAAQAAEKIRSMIAQKAYRHQDNYTAVILSC